MCGAAAIHSARELGVIARISEAPADPAAVATDCGLTPQGAAALLSALAGLDLLELGGDGRFRPAHSGLVQLVELLRPWAVSSPYCVAGRGRQRGDNRRGGVPLSESRPTDRGSLPPKRRTGSRLLAQPDSGCSTSAPVLLLEPRHRRARAQFHRHGRGPAGGDEVRAPLFGKLDSRIGMNSSRKRF